jgi:hypothetical protein
MDMASLPWKLLFKAHFHQFLTQNSNEGFWQPRGTLGDGNGHMKREEGWAICDNSDRQIN